jgi:hypothetical protein
VVDSIEGDTVRLHQDSRDTPQFWFYWCFDVEGAQGRRMTFEFTQGNVFGTRGPAVSLDDGKSWRWLGAGACQGDSFQYAFSEQASRVRFAYAIPYTQLDWDRFLERHAHDASLLRQTLTRSPRGREVELIRVGPTRETATHRILLTCRHHACESLANFVLEGVVDAALADSHAGHWFRQRAEIIAVPFMDKDGVQAGDQGKLRAPHDHWLDYQDPGQYPETRALRSLVEREATARPFSVALDLHCPYLRDSKMYYALGSDPQIAESTAIFCERFAQRVRGSVPYSMEDNMPFQRGWNGTDTYTRRRSFWQWAQSIPGMQVVATLEVPYASIGDTTMSPDIARSIGGAIAESIAASSTSLAENSRN